MRSNVPVMRNVSLSLGLACLVTACIAAGCPSGTVIVVVGSGDIVNTGIEIQKDGMVAAGEGIIAFGSSLGGSKVSYLKVGSMSPVEIPGSFAGDAVYCAGTKVILVAAVNGNDPRSVTVFDTASSTFHDVPDTDVFDIVPGANLENAYIAVDGDLVAILHRGAGGIELKVIDVSGSTPVVKTFTAVLNNASHVDVDGETGEVVVMEDNRLLAIFKASAAATLQPTRFDIPALAGVTIAYSPKSRIGSGRVIFSQFSPPNVLLLDIDAGTVKMLAENPGASNATNNHAIKAGFFAYYLDRLGVDDSDSAQGNRVAIGEVASPDMIFPGSGANLGAGTLAGFGHSVAIAPDGSATYIAGRFGQSLGGGVNEPTVLQRNFGSGFEALLTDDAAQVLCADVSTAHDLVAFKVSVDGATGAVLGYFVPSQHPR